MADPELEEPDELEPDELEPDELEPDEPEPDEPELEGSAVLPRGTACAQAEEGTATVKVESKQSASTWSYGLSLSAEIGLRLVFANRLPQVTPRKGRNSWEGGGSCPPEIALLCGQPGPAEGSES